MFNKTTYFHTIKKVARTIWYYVKTLLLWPILWLFIWPALLINKEQYKHAEVKLMVQVCLVILYLPFVFLIAAVIDSKIYWYQIGPTNLILLNASTTLAVPADRGLEPFNPEHWFGEDDAKQMEEARKLIKQKILENKTKEEVLILLGLPDSGIYQDADDDSLIYEIILGVYSKVYALHIVFHDNKPNEVYFELVYDD